MDKNIRFLDEEYYNQISIIVEKTKYNKIINSDYNNNISEIIINGDIFTSLSEINDIINKTEEIFVEIIIKFQNKLTSCLNMFKESNIISIDFSQFDSSSVTTMESMFEKCNYLKSINFQNLILLQLLLWKICLRDVNI